MAVVGDLDGDGLADLMLRGTFKAGREEVADCIRAGAALGPGETRWSSLVQRC